MSDVHLYSHTPTRRPDFYQIEIRFPCGFSTFLPIPRREVSDRLSVFLYSSLSGSSGDGKYTNP